MLGTIISDHRAWMGKNIQGTDWCVTASDAANKELTDLVKALRRAPLPTLLLTPEDYQLPILQNIVQQARFILDEGCGFTVLK